MRPINFFFFDESAVFTDCSTWEIYDTDSLIWMVYGLITQNTSFKISLVSAYFYNVKQGNLRYILLLHFYNSNMHRLILPSWKNSVVTGFFSFRCQSGGSGLTVKGTVMEENRPDSGRFYRPRSAKGQGAPVLRFGIRWNYFNRSLD